MGLCAVAAWAVPAAAQDERITFERGTTGTEVRGRLDPGASVRYLLNAREGQHLDARLASRSEQMRFQIFNPDSSMLWEYDGSDRYRGDVWQSGDHVIEVYNLGQQRAGYRLIVSVSAEPSAQRPRPPAQSEPEFWEVTGLTPGDVLNVRAGPSTRNDIVGALSNGTMLRNLGCRQEGDTRWCHVEQLDDMRSRGWVSARYLTDSAGPDRRAPRARIDHGGLVRTRCAEAVAREVGISPDDVVITNTTTSEGTGLTVVYVGVPRATADWICEARSDGTVVNVFFGG